MPPWPTLPSAWLTLGVRKDPVGGVGDDKL